jgi:hypothetical protein
MSYAYLDSTACLLNVKTLFEIKWYSITHIIENYRNRETQKHTRKHFIHLYRTLKNKKKATKISYSKLSYGNMAWHLATISFPHSNFTLASLRESNMALTLPWYFCSLDMETDTTGIPLNSKRSPSSSIFAAAATSRVDSMLGLRSFSLELAEHATMDDGVCMT